MIKRVDKRRGGAFLLQKQRGINSFFFLLQLMVRDLSKCIGGYLNLLLEIKIIVSFSQEKKAHYVEKFQHHTNLSQSGLGTSMECDFLDMSHKAENLVLIIPFENENLSHSKKIKVPVWQDFFICILSTLRTSKQEFFFFLLFHSTDK